MSNPYDVVRQFEAALCDYTGAKYAVTTTSCTSALLLAVAWHVRPNPHYPDARIEIPRHTYVGVAQSILNAGGCVTFRDQQWAGGYQLKPYPIWDYARWLSSDMFRHITAGEVAWRSAANTIGNKMLCISFHHTKHLGISTHGGAILHDNEEADAWLRRARFDGRKEGVEPKDDYRVIRGWHCYMTPPTAAEGLMRLATLPKHNEPLPWGPGTNSDYTNLAELDIFK